MNELGRILRSIRASNPCEDNEHKQCERYGRITQECIAGKIGVRGGVVSKIENGDMVSYNMAGKVCEYLGLNVGDYADGVYISYERPDVFPVKQVKFHGEYKATMERFGVDLRKAREAKRCEIGCCHGHLGRTHLAAMFGLTSSVWRNIEFGGKVFGMGLFLQICDVMDLNPLDYIGAPAVVGIAGADAEALSWVANRGGRIAFGDTVIAFVPGYTPSEGDTIVEAVAWLRRKVAGGKKVA